MHVNSQLFFTIKVSFEKLCKFRKELEEVKNLTGEMFQNATILEKYALKILLGAEAKRCGSVVVKDGVAEISDRFEKKNSLRKDILFYSSLS